MAAIETIGLEKSFRGRKAVDGLNLTVEEGELVALLGVNGAGKTTTIRMLSCLCRPSGGEARVFGRSVVTEPARVKPLINLSPQETAVAPNLTVRENLVFLAGIYGSDKQEVRRRADEIIAAFSLGEWAHTRAKILSGGWQRRLSIAMALITEPRVLFLDEPTLGLDILARRELWKLIEAMKGRRTVILTTHYLEEAEMLADRIAVMAQGSLRALGTAAELKAQTGAQNFEDAFVAIAEGGENHEE